MPHFASLYSKTRQLAVLRSNDGETWKEHKAPCNEHVFNKQYASEGFLFNFFDNLVFNLTFNEPFFTKLFKL